MRVSLPLHHLAGLKLKRAVRLATLSALIATVAALQGCATPATSQGMTVSSSMVGRTNDDLKHAIRIDGVNGGKNTNPLWTSQVGADGFKQALEGSLGNAGYLATSPDQAKYSLTANLLQLDQPLVGLTLDVASNVQYELTGSGMDKSIPIAATGSAGFSDAALAFERLRIANERSILENIKGLLKELAELKP
ncbi:MAG: hypothetical protein PHY45_03525 [Rhodocyclaceae bacterium]|nr:hypothetical protein [Rhodocyclaceae bacterium]